MKRVVIVGNSGAGKTELANALGRKTGLPVVYLDPIFWRSDWTRAPQAEAEATLSEEVARGEWILDGDFLGASPSASRVRTR